MGGGSTTVNNPAPIQAASPEELDIQRKNSDILTQQLEAIKSQNLYQQNMYDKASPLFDLQMKMLTDQASLAPQQLEAQKRQLDLDAEMAPLQKELLLKQLEQIRNGYAATPEQSRLIDEQTNSQLDAGRSDINEFSRLGLEQLRRELAPSAGMRPDDSPITDRGFQLEREATRQFGSLASNLRTANSAAKLNYPLAAAGVTNQASQFQQNMSQSIKDFQAQLAEQAAQNRLRTGLGVSQSGVGTAGTPGSPYGLTTGMMGARYGANYGGTTTTSTSPGIAQYGQLAQGVGALAAFMPSDIRLKRDIVRVGAMKKSRLPVYEFSYKWDDPSIRHRGVMAQEVERVIPQAVKRHSSGFRLVDYSEV